MLRTIRRRWAVVVAVTLVGVAAALAYVWATPRTYTASTQVYVSMATGTSVNDAYQGGLAAQQRVTSYSVVAGGVAVAERVVDVLHLPLSPADLQNRISVLTPPATTLIDISVTDSTPDGARILADEVAAQFRGLVAEMETTVVGAPPAAQIKVLVPAVTPTRSSGPNFLRLVVIGLLAGLALGCFLALLRDRFDPKVRTPEQLDVILNGVPVLGSISGTEPAAGRSIARLRARLAFLRGGPNTATLMLTSFSGHSVPTVALRLSSALVGSKRGVALVDADVSGAGVSAVLGIRDQPGVADWLRKSTESTDDLLRPMDGVAVVPLGAADDRTSDLLGSDRLVALISRLQARFDYVLVDTAPTPADATALTLSSRYNGTLAVVELGKSLVAEVRTAAASFCDSGSGLLGVITVTATEATGTGATPATISAAPVSEARLTA